MTDSTLRALVDLRDRTLQKSRIAFGNRAGAIERGADQADVATQELVAKWQERFNALEKEADHDIATLAEGIPIVDELVQLKGISYTLAAKLVALVDITHSSTVSGLWRYAGYAVIDGARERPVKGEKLHYNLRLKTTCYLVGSSFLRCGSPYRQVYDSAREYYTLNRPDWTEGRRHNAAMRKMIKMFLSHLWERWRMLEGLPTREIYVVEQLGHAHKYGPLDFDWPAFTGPRPTLQPTESRDPSQAGEPKEASDPNEAREPKEESDPNSQGEPNPLSDPAPSSDPLTARWAGAPAPQKKRGRPKKQP